MRPIGCLPALILVLPVTAHAGFQLEATPSAPLPQVGAQAGLPSPYARSRALPVVQTSPAKPIAVGEGTVPLKSALLAIVPQDFHPTYTDAVDPKGIINWHGGKPWDVVLRDAVKPLGIVVAIKGNDVILSR